MDLGSYIDYTNLKTTVKMDEIKKMCEDAKKYHFASVCIQPYYVPLVHELLDGSTVNTCTVVGFPLGMNTKEVKAYETIDAINNGADEIDMVINMSAVKNGDFDYVKEEIEEIRDSIDGKVLKVIIETCYLTDDEIIKLIEICNETFVNFVKTSTGFGTEGAIVSDVRLINKYKNDILEIKAAGGIRTEEEMIDFIEAGATRIGTSHAVEIMDSCNHDHEEE